VKKVIVGLALLSTTALVGTAACGDDSGGTGGSSTSGTGGSGGEAATVGTASGTQNACKSDTRTPTTFVIRNETGARLWFTGAGFGPSALAAITIDGAASPRCPCDELEGCSISQASVSVDIGFLEPGESFEQTWVGLQYQPTGVGAGCIAENACEVGRRPADGDHTSEATAYRGEPSCPDPCDCDIPQVGLCNFGDGADAPTDPVTASTTFTFPPTGPVEIVFSD
jgi:hypothetical protein